MWQDFTRMQLDPQRASEVEKDCNVPYYYHLLRLANKGAVGREVVDWEQTLKQKWVTLHFGELKVETHGEQHVFEVQICLNDLDPKVVRVELYADGVNGGNPVWQEMRRVRQLAGASGGYVYSAAVSAARHQRTIRRE
jgi:glycogen phosphorylase